MAERLGLQALADAFELLLDMREGDRLSWLQGQDWCLPDKARLRRMLDADSNADACFMDAPALIHAQILDDDQAEQVEPQDLIGQQFGAFRIERLIGQGGMAAVFAARRVGADFDQLVAVKLLRRGLFSAVEQKLFLRERQLLAGCAHPNIAHLIDGGITAAGIPYLVLEYVDGLRLDDYVIEHKLDVRARIGLFMRMAGAVEAAHRALIVHRDIKPSNILVTADGTPKLLDFGVAKLLDDDATHQTLTTALTPGYAAPEQLRGAPITTSVDIYALGVVLHELLTGVRPSGPEIDAPSATVVRPTGSGPGMSPAPATQLRRMLRGDLDNILQKALREKPEQRYPSVTALIDDLQRYLDGRPVYAHPPSRTYLVGKFLRRNRLAVAFAGAALLATLGSFAGVLWQARATHAEAVRANAVRDLLFNLFRTAEQDLPEGERVKPEEIVDLGMRRVLDDGSLPVESRLELIDVLATIASSIGAYAQMDRLTTFGLTLARQVYSPDDVRSIDAMRLRAEALIHLGREREAVGLLAPFQTSWMTMDNRASFSALATFAVAKSRSAKAGDDEEIAILLRRLRERAEASTAIPHDLVFQTMIGEADQLAAMHLFKDALERGQAAEGYWKEHGLQPTSKMLWLYEAIGNSASSLGDAVRGESAYRDAINLSERIHKGPHRDTAWFVGLLGSYLVSLGRLDEAEPYVIRGLQMRRELYGESAPQTLFAINALSRLRAAQHRPEDSLSALNEGIGTCTKSGVDEDACVSLLQTRGRVHLAAGNLPEARVDIDTGIAMQTRISGADGPKVASLYAYLSEVLRREGRYVQSVATADKSLSIMERSGGGHWTNIAVARLQRAWSNLQLGNAQAAFDDMAEAEPRFAEASAKNVKARASMKQVAALALQQLSRFDEAKQWAHSALDLDPTGSELDAETLSTLRSIAAGRVIAAQQALRD